MGSREEGHHRRLRFKIYKPTFARCRWFRGQDRPFDRLGQPQVVRQFEANRRRREQRAIEAEG
jgi:hypothetical protein